MASIKPQVFSTENSIVSPSQASLPNLKVKQANKQTGGDYQEMSNNVLEEYLADH